MTIFRVRTRVVCFVGAMALLFLFAPVMAGSHDNRNRPVEVTFTKWVVPHLPPAPPPAPQPAGALLAGVTGGDIAGTFVGEVLWRPDEPEPACDEGLEAMYEVIAADEDKSFSALIRGGQNQAGAAQFDGVILAGWRTGARVHVVYQRYPLTDPACWTPGTHLRAHQCVSSERFTSSAPHGTDHAARTARRRVIGGQVAYAATWPVIACSSALRPIVLTAPARSVAVRRRS